MQSFKISTRRMLAIAVVSVSAYQPSAFAQGASEICKSVPVIFKESTIKTKDSYKSSYKQMLCSASWSTYQDAVNAGIDVTLPIYDIPVPLNANYSRSKQQAWQTANCSQEERQMDFASTGFLLAKEISPVTANAWLACVQATQEAGAIPRSLACKITETDSSTVFEAKWRIMEGAQQNEAPIARSLDVINTKCSGNPIKKGTKIGTGGVAVLCDGNTDKAPMFVLNTDRGSCAASGVLAAKVSELNGSIVMQSPLVFRGQNVKVGANLRIITNGHNLMIDANRLVIDGAPEIVSYITDQSTADLRGNSAGEIRIKAKKVEGGVLTVQNFGQNGGPGSKGRTGDKGDKGYPGERRHWKNFEGCVGGRNGGPGGQGKQGFSGQMGATGGNGGDVLIEVDQGLMDGAKPRIAVVFKRTDRANNPFNCNGTCPGLGGTGGPEVMVGQGVMAGTVLAATPLWRS